MLNTQTVQLAIKPPIGPDTFTVTEDAFKTQVEIDLGDFYTRMGNETLDALREFQTAGLEGAELAAAVEKRLRSLSSGPLELMGRDSTSRAFNLGRNAQSQKIVDVIKEVVRVEVMDGQTCEPCKDLNRRVFEHNSAEYFEFMPPAKCRGRHFCRGFYLFRVVRPVGGFPGGTPTVN